MILSVLPSIVLDIAASWLRMFIALFVSILFSIAVGIAAATNKRMEKVILPSLDILQTIPILGFFPVVIYLIVILMPNFIGINTAVIFLIFTSMVWNISFGVYESVKSIPSEFEELMAINHFSKMKKITKLYIPASMPRIAYQSMISWSIGLFYLVTSEIFSTGSKNFAVVNGIGVLIANLTVHPDAAVYVAAIALFIVAVILTRIFFLTPLSIFSERFSFKEEPSYKRSKVLDTYKQIFNKASIFFGKVSSSISLNGAFQAGKKRKHHAANTRQFMQLANKSSMPTVHTHRKATIVTVVALVTIAYLIVIKFGMQSELIYIGVALLASFLRVWFIYIICVAVALPLGIKIALSARAYEPILASLQVLSAIPATILLPVIVAALYQLPFRSELVALSIIFIAMIWYLMFSIISGMRTLPTQLLELKSMLRLKWTSAWKNIYIPAVLPSFITGSITAIGGAWNSLIVAEYFSIEINGKATVMTQVGTGIGKVIDIAVFQGNLQLTILALIAMTTMVIIINRLVWQRAYNHVTQKYRSAV